MPWLGRAPPAPLWGAAGKAGYALSCVAAALVLAVSGFSYFVVSDVSSIGGSHAINSGPSIGAQNILLMGLESRTDWNGNVLPNDILNALHAGSRQGVLYEGVGGNATNTLILIHIPAGGKKAIGFSIPRDDWVTFPQTYDGQTQGKIDQAYGDALAEKESQVRQQNPSMSQNQVAFQGNEAGRAATVATVESLTGVHIDHFAEVNLDGFYELAKVLGGVQVCLKHPVALDTYSGFYAKKAGYQHLNAKMALAFVRQRHGLPNGDLDRTHRQQAFLDSVMQQLRTEGVLGDLTKINSLLSVAKQYVITDSGWNLLDFATQMRSLTSGNLSFHTLPIESYITIDGQSANQVNVPLYPADRAQHLLPGAPRRQFGPAAAQVHGHGQRGRGRRDHRGRAQRRQHPGAGRAGLGRPGQGRVQGRAGLQHHRADRDPGALRHRRGGERRQDRVAVRRHRDGERRGGGRARPGEPGRGRHASPGHAVRLELRDGPAHHGRAGRRGHRQERHPLRRLRHGTAPCAYGSPRRSGYACRHEQDPGDRREGRP